MPIAADRLPLRGDLKVNLNVRTGAEVMSHTDCRRVKVGIAFNMDHTKGLILGTVSVE